MFNNRLNRLNTLNTSNTSNIFSIIKRPNLEKQSNTNPCEELWLNGIHVLPIDKTEAVSIKGGLNCRIQINGQFIFIKTTDLNIDAFLNSLPLYDSIPEENGYYTWIIYSVNNGEKKIALNKVLSYLEIGTKHTVLAYRTDATKIHAAGELQIENGVKNVNLLSGSFMKDVFESRRLKKQKLYASNRFSNTVFCDETMLQEFIETQLKHFFGDDSVVHTYEFITKENCPINKEELDTYERYGAKIYLFNSKNECNEYYTQSYKKLKGGKSHRKTKKLLRKQTKQTKRNNKSRHCRV